MRQCLIADNEDAGIFCEISFSLRPTDHGETLVNPGMGWTLHFYSNFIENFDCKQINSLFARPQRPTRLGP